jgi:hypothetical protein
MESSSTSRWVVTAPQIQPRSASERAPWGVHHVRREGSSRTACGLPTATWFVFWGRRFLPGAKDACPDCGFAQVVGQDLRMRPTALAGPA